MRGRPKLSQPQGHGQENAHGGEALAVRISWFKCLFGTAVEKSGRDAVVILFFVGQKGKTPIMNDWGF